MREDQKIIGIINPKIEKIFKEILRIIGGHDSRKEPISLNDKVVKDADKLSRYSKEYVVIYSENLVLLMRKCSVDFRKNWTNGF